MRVRVTTNVFLAALSWLVSSSIMQYSFRYLELVRVWSVLDPKSFIIGRFSLRNCQGNNGPLHSRWCIEVAKPGGHFFEFESAGAV